LQIFQINPQHTVPTLSDTKNGLCISESRAIVTYLAENFAKDDSWYPKDPVKRALVNQRLYFDIGALYGSLWDYLVLKYSAGAENSVYHFRMNSALEILNVYLEGNQFVCGDQPTIADISILASITAYEVVKSIDLSKYANVAEWFTKCKEIIPGYQELKDGMQLFKDRQAIMFELSDENNPEFKDFVSGLQLVYQRYEERKNKK
jgi:glutathione S-transferase